MATSGRSQRAGGHRSRAWLWAGAAVLAVIVVAAAVALFALGGSGPGHVVMTPDKIGVYIRRPQLEQQMNARDLQQQVTAKSAGQVSHAVYAVHEDNAGVSASSGPILFIGGDVAAGPPPGFLARVKQQI